MVFDIAMTLKSMPKMIHSTNTSQSELLL